MIQERRDNDYREHSESSDEIVEEIRANRARIDSSLETLAEQLSPERLVDATAREIAELVEGDPLELVAGAYTKVRSIVRRHPISAALVVAGIAAFMLESGRRSKAKPRTTPPAPTAVPPEVPEAEPTYAATTDQFRKQST